jgi:hypothetical protein
MSRRLEQALELVRIEIAADDEAQAVGDERRHVMIREHHGIFLEDRAGLGLFEIRLDRHHAFFADLHEDVVDELQQRHIFLALVARPFRQVERALKRSLGHLRRIAGDERAERRADDDHDLGGCQSASRWPPSRTKPPTTHASTTMEPMS